MESNSTERTLLIGGADFTRGFVCSLAIQLVRSGRGPLATLGITDGAGRPADVPPGIFAEVEPFPGLETRPRTPLVLARLARELVVAPANPVRGRPPGGLRARAQARATRAVLAREMPRRCAGADLLHWHCLHPSRLEAMAYLPQEIPLIASFWGSDLYRINSGREHELQALACARANLITVASHEMQARVVERFGSSVEGKLRLAAFGADHLDDIDSLRDEPLATHLAVFGLPDAGIVIALGHSGAAENQHLGMLAALGQLPSAIRERLRLILPMTYARVRSHVEQVRTAAAGQGLNVHVIERPLTPAEVAHLRLACAITIHLPISDQFSSSMRESLHAGSILVTGSWLPYSRLREAGVHMHEIDDLAALPVTIERILGDLEGERARAAAGIARLQPVASWDHLIHEWLAVHDEARSMARSRS